MNDRAVNLLDQYEIEVLRTRKGRGAILCDTKQGPLIFMEYQGPREKVQLQNKLLQQIAQNDFVFTEQLLPTKEGELLVQDQDGVSYLLKTWYEGRECNVQDFQECKKAMEILAKLHSQMHMKVEDLPQKPPVFHLEKEYGKHNRELKKVRRYLRDKGQKTAFERYLLQEYDYFLDQAMEVTKDFLEFLLPTEEEILCREGVFCHGDYQYHNVVQGARGQGVLHFEKCIIDDQIRDLYLFLRKLLEKNNWSKETGERLLDAYSNVRPISARSFVNLYYRMAYPEKFWKIVNFYYNTGKAWIPEKNMEKLQKVIAQEKSKQEFLNRIFRTV